MIRPKKEGPPCRGAASQPCYRNEDITLSPVASSAYATDGLALFLKAAQRDSTRRFGTWVWDRLRDHPEAETLNLRQAARDLRLSRETVRRSVEFFTRFGRLLCEGDYSDRANPGRPRRYRLHPCYRKAEQMAISAKVAYLQPKTSRSCTSTSCHMDVGASVCEDEARQPRPVTRQGDPASELHPLQARRRLLGRVRDHVRTYPGISWLARDRIVAGVGTALALRWPLTGPAIRRGDVDAVARAIMAQLDAECGYSGTARRAHGFGAVAVAIALDVVRQSARLRSEAQNIERLAAAREAAAWARLTAADGQKAADSPSQRAAAGFRGQGDVSEPLDIETRKRAALAALRVTR